MVYLYIGRQAKKSAFFLYEGRPAEHTGRKARRLYKRRPKEYARLDQGRQEGKAPQRAG